MQPGGNQGSAKILYYYPPKVEAVLDWTLEKEMKLKANRKSEDTLIID